MGRVRVAVIGTVILVLLAAGLAFLNFRAAASNTSTSSSVSTARLKPGASTGTVGMPSDNYDGELSIWLYIEGDDAITAVLRRELPVILEGKPGIVRVMLLHEPPTTANHPAMVAAISEQDAIWTPVYARARLRARFTYASDKGNISWHDEEAFTLYEPAVRLRGDFTLTDETRGLISRPAHRVSSPMRLTSSIEEVVEKRKARVGKKLKRSMSCIWSISPLP